MIIFSLAAALSAMLPQITDPPGLAMHEALIIPACGKDGRTPLRIDLVEEAIVRGVFEPPTVGGSISLPDGSSNAWVKAEAGENGWIDDPKLVGGYAMWTIEVPNGEGGAVILNASGHSVVYVNGMPRAGDPYAAGFVRTPVVLNDGTNALLFRVGRGRLRASIEPVDKPAAIDLADATLPDVVLDSDQAPIEAWCGVVVRNQTDSTLSGWTLGPIRGAEGIGGTSLPAIAPLTSFKAPVLLRIMPGAVAAGSSHAIVLQLRDGDGTPVDEATVTLATRAGTETRKVTFRSAIDGSVQYYSVVPAKGGEPGPPGLVLTLHGASVEATNQAGAYTAKSWCHIVAPTNRRPYGFDWEDWGRRDALEVLAHAESTLKVDARRRYLTGHSMGGHGVWQVGAHFPDRFAAIAPSAGWPTFWSYAGGAEFEDGDPVQAVLRRAVSGSDTMALVSNYKHFGVYMLHGDADETVPVDLARLMRRTLSEFHADFAYREVAGAGHWWGNACVDWPPLMQFFQERQLPAANDVKSVEFATSSPGVSASCNWATIIAQRRPMLKSEIRLKISADDTEITGTTENVFRLDLDVPNLAEGGDIGIMLDSASTALRAPRGGVVHLERSIDGSWALVDAYPPGDKHPARCGPFKCAFDDSCVLVYATHGAPEVNLWSLNKARYDSETFWVRGNGALRIVSDDAFLAAAASGGERHNVILYGNASCNSAWANLLADEDVVRARDGSVTIGDRTLAGDEHGLLAIRPFPGSDSLSIGLVGGSGLVGMRITDRMPYFLSGVAYPDYMVFTPELLKSGAKGITAAGFFEDAWGMSSEDSAIREALP